METTVFWTATTLYALASVAGFAWLAFRRRWLQTAALAVAVAALVPHLWAIVLRWQEVGHGPVSSRYEVVSANTFVLVLVWAAVSLARPRLRVLGVAVLPLAFLAMGWAVDSFGVRHEAPIIFKSYWLWLHVGFAKLFFATSVLAGVSGLGYLIRERRAEGLEWLPETTRLDLWGHQFLIVSFLCLGVMIIAGSLWAHQSWGRYWGWDPIETAALVNWLAFGLILHMRALHRWRGRKMAWLHLVAFALAIITLYVVVLVLPTIHDFYMKGG